MPSSQALLFQEIGLTPKEAIVYETLLKQNILPAQKVVLEANLPRSTVYQILDQLTQKGLVEQLTNDVKTKFRAKHPYALKEFVEKQALQVQRSHKKLDTIMKDLVDQYQVTQKRPGIRFEQGLEGIQKLYLELLAANSEILSYAYTDSQFATKHRLHDFFTWCRKARLEAGVSLRVLAPNNSDGRKYKALDESRLRTTVLIPEDQFEVTTNKYITTSTLAYFSLHSEEMIGILITSNQIANTEKTMFEALWNQYKK